MGGNNVTVYPQDSKSGAIRTIDSTHGKAHDGLSFVGSHYEIVGAASAVNILITAPATNVHHFTAEIDVDGPGILTWSRAPNATATAGSIITCNNKYEDSTNTNTLVHVANGTYTSSGTVLETFVIGGSSGIGANINISGGESGSRDEWLLGLSSVHLLRWVADLASCRTVIRTHFYRET